MKYSITEYIHGRCQIFALALATTLKYKPVFLWDSADIADMVDLDEVELDDLDDTPPALIHAYCIRPNGTFVDATGTITEEEAEQNHGDCWQPDHEELSVSEVKKMMRQNKVGRPDPGELEQISKFIQKNLDVYRDGKRKIRR